MNRKGRFRCGCIPFELEDAAPSEAAERFSALDPGLGD